ncbi:MAG: Ig-like domain-containing protein [Planctomycetota bacterium]|jgi:hypothetical protein
MNKPCMVGLLVLFVFLCAGCDNKNDEGTPFLVINTDPSDLQTNVVQQTIISIRFTNHVDHTTVQGTKQIILVNQSNSVIPTSFHFNGEYVTVTPGSPLAPNATYGLAVRPGVRDIYGSNIDVPFAITFSTGPNLATIPNWPPFIPPSQTGPQPIGPPGTFVPVGPLNVPRARHTANRLPDGRVIVIGGERQANFSRVERSAELFDPNTLSWTPSQSNGGLGMYFERCGHSSTLLENGQILVAGGTHNGLQAHTTAEIYDYVTDTFSAVPGTMNFPRMFHADVRMPNGNVLLVCGATSTIQIPQTTTVLTNTMEVYDVNSGTFQMCVANYPMVLGIIYQTADVLPDGTIMIAGGLAFITAPGTYRGIDIYTPGSGIGVQGTLDVAGRAMKNFRCEHRTVIVPEGAGTGLVVFTGGMSQGGAHRMAEVYDYQLVNPNTGKMGMCNYIAHNMAATRRSHTANFIPGSAYAYRPNPWGKILVVGGAGHTGTIGQPPPYPPHAWPFIEPAGCSCVTTVTAEILDLFGFGMNVSLPYKGVDQTGQHSLTTDAQGNVTVVPGYISGLYWHTGTTLLNGCVLIAGGMDCPIPCLGGLVEGVPMASCSVYNP